MTDEEKYDFEIPEEGFGYDILDLTFNEATQLTLLASGLKEGMLVLDVGSGSGVMTQWLAEQVGPSGKVIALDNNEYQQEMAKRRIKQANLNNVEYENISVYDLSQLDKQFDLIYCRFVLHHLHYPRRTIELYYKHLKKSGIYYGEEGIMSSAFAYPCNAAWQYSRPEVLSPNEEQDGLERDSDFGMKLGYWAMKAGFNVDTMKLQQPVLYKKEDKYFASSAR